MLSFFFFFFEALQISPVLSTAPLADFKPQHFPDLDSSSGSDEVRAEMQQQ